MGRWVAALWLVSAGALAQEMSADDQRARTHFESGRSYFEEGAYDRALEEFQRAYDLSRRPALLVNLATTNERLANYGDAIANLRAYLAAVPDDPSRVTLERRIQNLERLQAERGTSGGTPEPVPTETTTTTTTTATTGGGGGDGLMIGGIIALSVAGASAVLLGTFGGLALAEDSALASGCGATRTCTPDDVANADTFALVSDVFLGVTIAAAAAGAVLVILGATSSGGGERASFVPWVTADSGGGSVQGRF